MSSQTISIDFATDILLELNESENDLKRRIRILLAIQLYKSQKLTIGKATQLAGLTRLEFETELSKNKISISSLTEEDLLEDIEKINNLDPRVRGMLPKKNLIFRGKPRGIKPLAIAPRLK